MRFAPPCLIAVICLALLMLMPLLPRGSQTVQQTHLFAAETETVLAYFGFPGCQTACPQALGQMAALEQELTPEQIGQLDRVFVNIDPHSDVQTLDTWLGGYREQIRTHHPSAEERQLIERRLGLRLHPSTDQPIHANVFVLLQQEAPDQWRVRTTHRKLPLTDVRTALAQQATP